MLHFAKVLRKVLFSSTVLCRFQGLPGSDILTLVPSLVSGRDILLDYIAFLDAKWLAAKDDCTCFRISNCERQDINRRNPNRELPFLVRLVSGSFRFDGNLGSWKRTSRRINHSTSYHPGQKVMDLYILIRPRRYVLEIQSVAKYLETIVFLGHFNEIVITAHPLKSDTALPPAGESPDIECAVLHRS